MNQIGAKMCSVTDKKGMSCKKEKNNDTYGNGQYSFEHCLDGNGRVVNSF